MSPATITRIRLEVFQPAPKTRWQFLTLECSDGLIGVGEATWQADEDRVFARAADLLAGLIGTSAGPELVARIGPVSDIAGAAVLSALSHALWDVAGKRSGKPVAALLGKPMRQEIALYANINRRSVARTPEAFAESARLALASGFEAFKLAPFDEVDAAAKSAGTDASLIGPGLSRIAAVREVIGPDRDLMVDCHWRFSVKGAETALEALEPFGLYWFECPLRESDEMIPEIVRIRKLAGAAGMKLAGCETMVGVAGFEPFIGAGAYDVIMPDIKYVGSMEEMLALAERLSGSGMSFSPHNPSGPVSHAASLHLCAVAPGFTRLEMQFDETPLFWDLAAGGLPRPSGGASVLPSAPGLGISLDADLLAAYRRRAVDFGHE